MDEGTHRPEGVALTPRQLEEHVYLLTEEVLRLRATLNCIGAIASTAAPDEGDQDAEAFGCGVFLLREVHTLPTS